MMLIKKVIRKIQFLIQKFSRKIFTVKKKLRKLKKIFSYKNLNRNKLILWEKLGFRKPDYFEQYTASKLAIKLWAGFSRNGFEDLVRLRDSQTANNYQKRTAAIHLAKWFGFKNDYETALKNILLAKQLSDKNLLTIVMIHAEILNQLGSKFTTRSILQEYLKKIQPSNDVMLMYANTFNVPDNNDAGMEVLRRLNSIYEDFNLVTLKKIDESEKLNFFNITGDVQDYSFINQNPKISVIMPAHNAESTIGVAIQSLLNQTWKNLELIVVDDLSTDSTYKIISEFSEQDQRVIPIQHTTNLGAYGARNSGLNQVTGDYITVNDSDDWAHPQKLESQIKGLLSDVSAIANVSNLIRVNENLYFYGAWIIGKELIRVNRSALMFHNSLIHILGGWDMIRVSSDSEFIERIKHIFGADSVKTVLPQIPLTLCLDLNTNLTKRTDSHLKTLYFGKRGDYTEAAKWWRDHTIIPKLKIDPFSEIRPFQIPDNIRIKPIGERSYDYVVVTDFCHYNDSFKFAHNFILHMTLNGKKIAIFHYPDYERLNEYRKPLIEEIYELINNKKIDRLSIGETIRAKEILFFNPGLLTYQIDSIPKIHSDNLVIISHEKIPSDNINIPKEEQAKLILNSINATFGQQMLWIPTSESIKENIKGIEGIHHISDINWPVLINPNSSDSRSEMREISDQKLPRIGFVPFLSKDDFPNKNVAFRNAYCANQRTKILMYGDDIPFAGSIKKIPENWCFISSKEKKYQDFLKNLDFYLYFPDESRSLPMIHEVIEALSMGCVVISSHQYQNFFSDAVLYAKPKEVWITIQQYWNDKDLYNNQSQKGIDFVKTRCNFDNLRTIFEE